ncbi:MAG: addiction module toxin RelE [Ginsengibacter sp.]
MIFSVIPSGKFKRETQRLIKKFPSLKSELADSSSILEQKPETGTALSNYCYKIRLTIKRKGKGKNGGGRVITYVVTEKNEVYLLTIYDKSELNSIVLTKQSNQLLKV